MQVPMTRSLYTNILNMMCCLTHLWNIAEIISHQRLSSWTFRGTYGKILFLKWHKSIGVNEKSNRHKQNVRASVKDLLTSFQECQRTYGGLQDQSRQATFCQNLASQTSHNTKCYYRQTLIQNQKNVIDTCKTISVSAQWGVVPVITYCSW